MITGVLSVVFWVVPVKPKGKGWPQFLLGLHASAAGIAGEIFSSDLSWWLPQLPDDPLRAAGSFPWLLSEHVDSLQAQYGGLAGLSTFTSAAFATLGSCFALEQAFRLLQRLGEAEGGRTRAKSSLYGSARSMPRHHMRRLSREPGGLILGAESKSPKSRLVFLSSCRRSAYAGTTALRQDRDRCSQSATTRGRRLPRIHDRRRSAGRTLVRDGAPAQGDGLACAASRPFRRGRQAEGGVAGAERPAGGIRALESVGLRSRWRGRCRGSRRVAGRVAHAADLAIRCRPTLFRRCERGPECGTQHPGVGDWRDCTARGVWAANLYDP